MSAAQGLLAFAAEDIPIDATLDASHYLGAPRSGIRYPYADRFGIIVFAPPRSRRLPQDRWLELVRWCLTGEKNGGSRQWSAAARWVRENHPGITTIISYSDPSVGHTGALYRACNWLWAPTWHRLREPPSGNGDWGNGKRQAVKDRWVFPLAADADRAALLAVQDAGLVRLKPWAQYREPRTRRGVPVIGTGGGDYGRWRTELTAATASNT